MFFSSQTEVYIYREPVDMRKGHDGLAGIVESEMNLELLSGSIFLFVNKTRRLCKAIYFDGSGLVIIHKRMEVGSIMNFLAFGKVQKITISELALLMDGATLRIRERGKNMSTVNLREDLKSDPKYLNEVIKVMDSSIVALKEEIRILYEKLENSSQSELIDLQDKIAMLNKQAFGGSESLNKHRPRRDTQRELLPHNKSPLEGEIAPDKQRELPIVEVIHEEACCPGCDSPDFEEITGLYEESEEIDLRAQLARV